MTKRQVFLFHDQRAIGCCEGEVCSLSLLSNNSGISTFTALTVTQSERAAHRKRYATKGNWMKPYPCVSLILWLFITDTAHVMSLFHSPVMNCDRVKLLYVATAITRVRPSDLSTNTGSFISSHSLTLFYCLCSSQSVCKNCICWSNQPLISCIFST